jgi:hypothetical protein
MSLLYVGGAPKLHIFVFSEREREERQLWHVFPVIHYIMEWYASLVSYVMQSANNESKDIEWRMLKLSLGFDSHFPLHDILHTKTIM